MAWLGFNVKTLNILKSYLSERRQYVSVDSFDSDPFLVGPRSVTQGSTLSCILYIIYILDITSIYHSKMHDPKDALQCSKIPVTTVDNNFLPSRTCMSTSAKSFVDDNILLTRPAKGQSIQDAVAQAISKIEDYTNANLLALNPEKSRIMLLSKDKDLNSNFQITIGGKILKHQPALKILGNIISQDLSWDAHVRQVVIPSLSNRAHTLREVAPYMSENFRKLYAGAIFRGKLSFAVDAWGGASKVLLSKVQTIQDRVTKTILGRYTARLSSSQRLKKLEWPNVKNESILATMRLTHKIVHRQIPEELALKMPINSRVLIHGVHKLATKPKFLLKKQTNKSVLQKQILFLQYFAQQTH